MIDAFGPDVDTSKPNGATVVAQATASEAKVRTFATSEHSVGPGTRFIRSERRLLRAEHVSIYAVRACIRTRSAGICRRDSLI
jgi:hypothetical protein